MKNLVAQQWEDYALNVVPMEASREQRWETRRAFYAGAFALLTTIMSLLSPEAEPTPEDLVRVNNIYRELVDFQKAVKAGRA